MVFHDIESISDVISGHRIIVYYIESKASNKSSEALLSKQLDLTLEMLEKKNDDLLIIKILEDSYQYQQFKLLYRSDLHGVVTLFIVNNEGIPIICKEISQEGTIPQVIQHICATCNLNTIPNIDYLKNKHEANSKFTSSNPDQLKITKSLGVDTDDFEDSKLIQSDEIIADGSIIVQNNSVTAGLQTINTPHTLTTQLQIRLPNGNKDTQEFGANVILKEVWDLISSKYKLKAFDLKTYNHQVFSVDEYQKTLQELDLCPNGVIIVVFKNTVSLNHQGGVSAIIQTTFGRLINKTFSLFCYVQGVLLMFWNSVFSNNRGSSERQISSPSTDRGQPSKKSKSKFGNIHTLNRNEDSDDEHNRYNGNSTQQK